MYLTQKFSKYLLFYSLSAVVISAVLAEDLSFTQAVTFERAYQIALERSPRELLLKAQQEAAEGLIEQSAYKPNPTLGAEIENILGTGNFEGFDGTEVTLSISQLIERGDKQQRRSELATRSQELLRWDYEEAVSKLRYKVMQAFSTALVAQRNVILQRELLELANSSELEIERLSNAARATEIELSQAKLATSQQQFQLKRAQRQLTEAKIALSSHWNIPEFVGFELEGELELETSLPDLSTLMDLVDDAPAVARFAAESEVQQAAVDLEKARANADYELFGGARYLREGGGDAAFVLGIEMPWQIRNKNQGNVRSAIAGLRVVDSQREVIRREAMAQLAISYGEFQSSLEEWKDLKEELLPSAEVALSETEVGYQRGIVLFLNVLEARKALFEIRTAMLDTTTRYLTAQANIERLTRPAKSLP